MSTQQTSIVAAPIFMPESAPARIRGALVVGYQVATVVGITVAYFVDYGLAGSSDWRLMLALSGISARRSRNAPCPADPAQAKSCMRLRRWSKMRSGTGYTLDPSILRDRTGSARLRSIRDRGAYASASIMRKACANRPHVRFCKPARKQHSRVFRIWWTGCRSSAKTSCANWVRSAH